MAVAIDMVVVKGQLETRGHSCTLPRNTELYASGVMKDVGGSEGAQRKITGDLIRDYHQLIRNEETDAVLAMNSKFKNGVQCYVGGNTFLEMGFAHIEHKKLFLFNPWSKTQETIAQEIEAMQPIVLFGDYDEVDRWENVIIDQGETQLALKNGNYRCSNDGQTIFRDGGQRIPPCSCGKGKWEHNK